jgi:hypothetical protein
MTNISSWGGNVLKLPTNLSSNQNEFHLFYSEIVVNGIHTFQTNCRASHAVSASPLGPFKYVNTVRHQVSHNVQPMVGPDGALYIFMIGSDTIGKHGPVMVGRADAAAAAASTTLHSELNWEWVTPDLHDLSGSLIAKDNPTAVMYGNGSVLLATRGIALFMADSWKGPYRMLSESVLPCGESCLNEDPFLWQSKRGLHLLMHDHKPFPYHKQVITYAFTPDTSGLSGWVFSGQEAANGTDIQFDDGSVHTFCSRQRPQLMFSEAADTNGVQHGRPLVFITGAQHGALTDDTKLCGIANANASEFNPYTDYSFTFAQPIGPATP